MLLLEIKKFIQEKNYNNINIMISGDFNSLPDSAVYELMTTGKVSSAHPKLPMNIGLVDEQNIKIPLFNNFGHEFSLSSAYFNIMETEPQYTNFNRGFNGTLDYIFYPKSNMKVIAALPVVPFKVINKTFLPNEHWSSDHVALVADFVWN